ncbi:uncharacterized protein Dus1 isoform X4 [Cardiocondyla obscurior]
MNDSTGTPTSSPMLGTGSLVLVTVIGLLSAVAAVLLIHLCFFHGYIACLGLTTYEYVRGKRERSVASTAVDSRNSRTTSTAGLCGMPYCTSADDENIRPGLCSRFCENNSSFLKNSANTTRMTNTTTDVYVCSTHEETRISEATTNGNKDASQTQLPTVKGSGSRNFRLCFSFDSRTTETSIEVVSSSQTDAPEFRTHGDSPDAKSSSTPSPVSCCFSIINYSDGGRHDGRKRRPGGEHRVEPTKRSCGTMRRIQTFLQTRLRKGSRQRSSSSSSSTIARHCGNKIIPQTGGRDYPEDIASALTEDQDRTVEATPTDYPRPPARLPALDLSRVARSKDISVLGSTAMQWTKRNQAHLRTRRSAASFSKKRPRFKIGSHVVTQTAQLSPIPESEFSKPATPRSPSRSGSIFSFPPLRE